MEQEPKRRLKERLKERFKERFKDGQIAVYNQIEVIVSKPKHLQEAYWQGFDKAVEKLRLIASKLDTCPYVDDEPPQFCFACTEKNWSRDKCKAWSKEV